VKVCLLILNARDGVQSLIQERSGDALAISSGSLRSTWKNSCTFFDNLSQCKAVIRELGNRLAKVMRLAGPIVDCEGKVVGRDGTRNGLTACFDRFYCCTCRCMLEDNAKGRKGTM